jgi:hypothetical protein
MRSYRKLKPLLSGETASINNKGLLLINTDTSFGVPISVELINFNNTITGFTSYVSNIVFLGPNATLLPNYNLIPFTVKRWTDYDEYGTVIGFELY